MKAAILFVGRFIAAGLGGVIVGFVIEVLIQWLHGTKNATVSGDTLAGLGSGFSYMMFALKMDSDRYAPTRFLIAGLLWLFANFAITFSLTLYGYADIRALPFRVMLYQGLGAIVAAWLGIRARERSYIKSTTEPTRLTE